LSGGSSRTRRERRLWLGAISEFTMRTGE
jgi:hypothetical protein